MEFDNPEQPEMSQMEEAQNAPTPHMVNNEIPLSDATSANPAESVPSAATSEPEPAALDTPTQADVPGSPSTSPIEVSPSTPSPRSSARQRGLLEGRSPRTRIAIGAVAAILLCALLVLLTDAGHLAAPPGQAHARPTPKPTTTATPIPSPTAEQGFQVYVDRADGFIIQYPTGWVYSSASPGIQFADDENSPGYITQVLLPGSLTSAGPTTNPDDSSVWVNYELKNLAKQWPQEDFTRSSTLTSTTIGGVVWQCGVGLVSINASTPTTTPTASAVSTATATPTQGTPTASQGATDLPPCQGNAGATATGATPTTAATATGSAEGSPTASPAQKCLVSPCIRVEVYATVYNGRPYIINLLASDDRFAAGAIEFFQPMLQTYQFLPTSS